ncbi:hypothetical protein [Rahnella inusitata]|uniref:hypothetical protein n=1 Tax=Rahnella inusitata TaxID=58169 RepID=UPI0039BE806F
MTDTTDIKALRELLSHKDIDLYHQVGVTVTTLRLLLDKADMYEAERQRADEYRDCTRVLADQLSVNALPKEVIEAVAELKGKMANPVVLEYRKHDGFTDPEKVRLINAVTDRCAAAIKKSGFTVKGDL